MPCVSWPSHQVCIRMHNVAALIMAHEAHTYAIKGSSHQRDITRHTIQSSPRVPPRQRCESIDMHAGRLNMLRNRMSPRGCCLGWQDVAIAIPATKIGWIGRPYPHLTWSRSWEHGLVASHKCRYPWCHLRWRVPDDRTHVTSKIMLPPDFGRSMI